MTSWSDTVHERFKANGIRLVAHVPDAALVGLIGACEADPDIEVLQLTREEEGVGILSGAYLGGTRGALLMQSSGLGNCVNALGGLPMAYRIPFLILITPRGRLSEFNPSQVPGAGPSRRCWTPSGSRRPPWSAPTRSRRWWTRRSTAPSRPASRSR